MDKKTSSNKTPDKDSVKKKILTSNKSEITLLSKISKGVSSR